VVIKDNIDTGGAVSYRRSNSTSRETALAPLERRTSNLKLQAACAVIEK
jgi:hypothetical protein